MIKFKGKVIRGQKARLYDGANVTLVRELKHSSKFYDRSSQGNMIEVIMPSGFLNAVPAGQITGVEPCENIDDFKPKSLNVEQKELIKADTTRGW